MKSSTVEVSNLRGFPRTATTAFTVVNPYLTTIYRMFFANISVNDQN